MDENEFLELKRLGREGRSLESKRSMPWKDAEFKAKIVKSVLAFSNVRDGGRIIIGVERQDDGTPKWVGVCPEDLATYDEDAVAAHVAEFADPYAKVRLERQPDDGTIYIIIQVDEFDDVPVVCRKDGREKLRRGAMYTRSHRIPESVEVPSQTEMREILDMATEKGIRKYFEMQERIGIPIIPTVSDADRFEAQLKGLR